MNQIEEIVKKHHITEKRIMQGLNTERLQTLTYEMNKLKVNRIIALYAYKLDEYYELLKKGTDKALLDELKQSLLDMEDNYNLDEYKELKWEYNHLMMQYGNYERSINVDFRSELKKIDIPNIYIYQEHNKVPLYENIVDDNTYLIQAGNSEIIYPLYDLKSNREYRHFYSKTSFKYLEEVSKDYSLSLENKKIGKIKAKKM